MNYKERDQLSFGKYMGKTISWVRKNDPDHLRQLSKYDWFNLILPIELIFKFKDGDTVCSNINRYAILNTRLGGGYKVKCLTTSKITILTDRDARNYNKEMVK